MPFPLAVARHLALLLIGLRVVLPVNGDEASLHVVLEVLPVSMDEVDVIHLIRVHSHEPLAEPLPLSRSQVTEQVRDPQSPR